MTAIGPGDFVECVTASPPKTIAGAIYRVTEIGEDGDFCFIHGSACASEGWLRLAGVDHRPFTGFCVHCFRPVYRPKSDLVEGLLKGTQERRSTEIPA